MIDVKRHPKYDNTNGWWHLEKSGTSFPPVSHDLTCDFAVIGAGWTGLAAARRLAERCPDAKIVLLDAARVGDGAAGRNSGFLFDVPFVFPPDTFKGREEEGREEIRHLRASVDHMRAFVHAPGTGVDIDAVWAEIGQYHVAATGGGEEELAVIDSGLRNLGEDFEVLDRAAAKAALGTDYYSAAIHTPGTVQINPLALARAYAATMPENVSIHELSPVTGIEPGSPARIATKAATVTAGKVLLTTNAFLDAFAGIKPSLIPVMTFAGLTKPLSDIDAQRLGGNPEWGLVPAALFGTSMRRRRDGRLLVRNTYAYAPRFQASAPRLKSSEKRLMLSLHRRWPDVQGFEMEWQWSGVVSFFRGANGFFGDVAPGVSAAVTSGMPVCILYGQQLAALATDGDGDALRFVQRRSNPGGLPPKPVLGLAARSAAALRQRKAWGEL